MKTPLRAAALVSSSSSCMKQQQIPVIRLFLLLTLLLWPTLLSSAQTFNEGKFNNIIRKLEGDVLDLAREIENFYATRCEDLQLEQCERRNYDECQSIYPNQECLSGESYHVPQCGDISSENGIGCSGLVDFSVSVVRLPFEVISGANNNPTDPQVIETVCYTQAMDEWLQKKKEQDQAYWDQVGVAPWAWYFGSHTGAFRMWPARQSETCGDYDPRVRPWYVAASSGPKNVIMILDTSGSMLGVRIELLKEAAKRVVSTLTVADRVAVLPFSTEAKASITNEDGKMFIATEQNKRILLAEIDKLEASGRTNFFDAFSKAFDVLDLSARDEITVNCNTALLFLTDGEMTEPENITDQDVLNLVSERIARTSRLLPKPILLFTYSVSEEQEVHELPSKLACSTEWGVWSKVTTDANIVDSLSSYYLLFALGLGVDQNEGFVAWVEPYQYHTGETLGTTVSVPVYDRSRSPPLFLGVAGVDFSLAALDAALGVEPGKGSVESISRISLVSTARCPLLDLELCQLESFRLQGSAGVDGLCSDNCTAEDYVQVEEEKCPLVTDYPSDLWSGVGIAGLPYEERVCCVIGETSPSDQCPFGGNDSGPAASALIVIILAAVGFVLCAGLCWWCLQAVDDDEDCSGVPSSPAIPSSTVTPVSSGPASSMTVTGPVLVGEVLPPSTYTVVAEPESPVHANAYPE